jgi:hypothetical protein
MIIRSIPKRVGAVAVAIATAVALATGVAVASSSSASVPPMLTPKAIAFRDTMRELWEDHGAFTRMAITSFAANSPDLKATEARLLENQVAIGNAVKRYYGRAGGAELTKLLKHHILDAVDVLVAAKSGSKSKLGSAEAKFFANGNRIAAFLHKANPRNWSLPAMRNMMKIHLHQVIMMGADELTGNYKGSVAEWNPYRTHLLMMADMLSNGIIKQFPARFR